MKDGLIRLTNEKDIFYDSVEKVYRYRGHCANCEMELKCQCYEELDMLLSDIDDIADTCCSSKCCLLIGEWGELDDAMQAVGLQKDLRVCLSELTEKQCIEAIKEYDAESILKRLSDLDSIIPISHLKNPSSEEQIEILLAMGICDVKDILWDAGIEYHLDIKDLTEDQAKRVLEILTEDADWDLMPSGDTCKT